MEPRLVIFKDHKGVPKQGFMVAEQEALFKVTEFSIAQGLISLIATYYCLYINYPKSAVAADELLFIQEALLEVPAEKAIRKRLKYNSLISAIID